MYDSLREEIERLHAEIATTEQKLGAAGDVSSKQHESLLCSLRTAARLPQEKEEDQLEVTLQKSECALTRVELAAQLLAAQAHSDAPTDKSR
jgi:hypothetical protein